MAVNRTFTKKKWEVGCHQRRLYLFGKEEQFSLEHVELAEFWEVLGQLSLKIQSNCLKSDFCCQFYLFKCKMFLFLNYRMGSWWLLYYICASLVSLIVWNLFFLWLSALQIEQFSFLFSILSSFSIYKRTFYLENFSP